MSFKPLKLRVKLPPWWPLAAIVLAAAALLTWRVTRDLMLAFLGFNVSKPDAHCVGFLSSSAFRSRPAVRLQVQDNTSQAQTGAINVSDIIGDEPGQITDEAEAQL